MAQRGRKPKKPELKAVASTTRADRKVTQLVPELEGPVDLPSDFETLKDESPKRARRLLATWNRKLEIYKARGQSVVGCESALYQYCLLEVSINESYESNQAVPASSIAQHRVYANEFYDTPASQIKTIGGNNRNPFRGNGKRPT